MNFKLWLINESDFALIGELPAEPGTTPVPPNHVRLYHYTMSPGPEDEQKFQVAELLRRNGIDIGKARGTTYGEPNVVWASSQMPARLKVFAEFSIAMDDPRWAIGKPDAGVSPQEYEARQWDCYFTGSIRPDEIIAVHEPWHDKYNYIVKNPEVLQATIAGEHDHLMDNKEYGPAVRRIKAERGSV